jgi:hypothetical protein
MSSRRTQQAPVNRSAAWRSSAESALPESATLLKQARPYCEDETEAAIQASLSAALEELDQLELGTKSPRPSQKMKIPKGMPPLPGGRAMPPLPLARVLSLRPRKSATPAPAAAPDERELPALPVAQEVSLPPMRRHEPVLEPAARWPGVVAAVMGLLLVGAAIWLTLRQ